MKKYANSGLQNRLHGWSNNAPAFLLLNSLAPEEVNIVSWNGVPAKIDIRDWSPDHERMSRGITLTEEQAEKLTKSLVERYRAKEDLNKPTPMRNDMAR